MAERWCGVVNGWDVCVGGGQDGAVRHMYAMRWSASGPSVTSSSKSESYSASRTDRSIGSFAKTYRWGGYL